MSVPVELQLTAMDTMNGIVVCVLQRHTVSHMNYGSGILEWDFVSVEV